MAPVEQPQHRGHAAGSRGRSIRRRSARSTLARGPVTRMPASLKALFSGPPLSPNESSSADRARVERIAAELVARKRARGPRSDTRAPGPRQRPAPRSSRPVPRPRNQDVHPRLGQPMARSGSRPSTSALFFDPKPRQLQSAASDFEPAGGVRDEVQIAAPDPDRARLIVGGSSRSPAPARSSRRRPRRSRPAGWPIIDLVDDPGTRSARAPNRRRTQRASTASFSMRGRAVVVHVADRRRAARPARCNASSIARMISPPSGSICTR